MVNSYIYVSVFLAAMTRGCAPTSTPQEISMKESDVTEADHKYANVFKDLDGSWSGLFLIYEDPNGQKKGSVDPSQVNLEFLGKLEPTEVGRVSVKQEYTSTSPYYQEVHIEDTYIENGREEKVVSFGINKIENGVMWCIVQKPDEKVIHRGSTEGEHTIIWGRSISDPLKVEYFRETVLASTYEIVGYGYYGSDDAKLTPRTWFHGKYQRID